MGLLNTKTQKASLRVVHLYEISTYNFQIHDVSLNSVTNSGNRPIPYTCNPQQQWNRYSQTCFYPSLAGVAGEIALDSPVRFIKTRFIDVPEFDKLYKPYNSDKSFSSADLCAFISTVGGGDAALLQCMASAMTCDYDLIRTADVGITQEILFSTYLYTALFVGTSSNRVTVFASMQNFSAPTSTSNFDKIQFSEINQLLFIGNVMDFHLTLNGQHAFATVERQSSHLEATLRFIQICKELKAQDQESKLKFLQPYEYECDSLPYVQLDLNQFGQYVSSCLPGMLCPKIAESKVFQTIPGFYSPLGRSNLNISCPVGSYCTSGIKNACPPGYVCGASMMSRPEPCKPSAFDGSTSCAASGLKEPFTCPQGKTCITPYFPPCTK